MTMKLTLLSLLALLAGALLFAGCGATGDDDDSADDDDDSAAMDDDDSAAMDDDDSAEGPACESAQAAFEACALIGDWDVVEADFCTMEGMIDAMDLETYQGCVEGGLMALDCSLATSEAEAMRQIEEYLLATAGCEGFGPDAPEATLNSIEISCTDLGGDTETSGNHSTWTVDLFIEPGWLDASDMALFMWDRNAGRYIDPHQPFTSWENTASGDFGSYDDWSISLDGWATIPETADAQADTSTPEATLLKCRDSAGGSQVENRDFMVCATDFNYLDLSHCWFCGEGFGEASTTDTVGTFGAWAATEIFDDTTSTTYPCFYADDTP